jgi:hypothetical protein
MSVLNGRTPFIKNSDFRDFGVSVVDVYWFTIDGTSCIVVVFYEEFLPMHQTHLTSLRASVCGWYEVRMTVTPHHFPWKGQVLIQKDVCDVCPVQVM